MSRTIDAEAIRHSKNILGELDKAFPPAPLPRTPEQDQEWERKLDAQRDALSSHALLPIRNIKLAVIDEDDNSYITLHFSAYTLSVEQVGDRVITRFSNGCILTQKSRPS